MSIWHNEPIPTDENKDVYVEFYTQIPYVDRETKSRCIVLASDCVDLEEPDLIRWCYLDDLLNQQEEIKRLREALSFYAMQKTIIKSVYNGKPCRMIYCCADVAEQALNDESEINE